MGLIDHASASPLSWAVDTVANFAAQAAMLACGAVLLAFVSRAWAAGALALVSVLVLVVQVLGVPRLAHDRDADGVRLRVIVFNALSGSDQSAAQRDAIVASGADVLAIVEPPTKLVRLIESDPELRAVYPYSSVPFGWVFAGPLIVSRYPLHVDADGFGAVWSEVVSAAESLGGSAVDRHSLRIGRIEHPSGPVVFVSSQFRSPRTPDRWLVGNRQAESLAEAMRVIRARTELPVVAAGDFNAVPLSSRSRRITELSGLRRAKPVLIADGTFPSILPRPGRLSIDDVFASEGVRVRSWRVIAWPGSDHLAMETELALPVHVPAPPDR